MTDVARRAAYVLLAGAYQLRIWLRDIQTFATDLAIRICRC